MSHSLFSGSGLSRSGRRVAALLLAVLMLSVVVVPMVMSWEPSDGETSETHTVVYHPYHTDAPAVGTADGSPTNESGTYGTVTVEYRGSFVSTEYNPQVWDVTDIKGSKAPTWYGITESGYSQSGVNQTVVFTGWAYGTSDGITSETYYPGEVMSEAQMEAATEASEDGSEAIHVYATWGTMTHWAAGVSEVNSSWSDGNEYTNIVSPTSGNGDINLNNLKVSDVGLTIRGNDYSDGTNKTNILWAGSGGNPDSGLAEVTLNQNVIIDNMNVMMGHSANHGDGSGGIFANGHVLIIGDGMSVAYGSDKTSLTGDFTQLFGGSKSADIESTVTDIENQPISRKPYGSDDTINFGTFMIVHSGSFANIVAGSRGHDIYSADQSESLSTYLVLRDVTVLDTVVGGSSGSISNQNNIYGIDGSAFTYAYGLKMYGDTYEERYLKGDTTYGIPVSGDRTVELTESTILTGGSNGGSISGNTHVFLAGDTSVWDVQGGGRRGFSSVQTANVEVSGDAAVRHALCGSITDGLTSHQNHVGYGSPNEDSSCV